jgi:hypothetical protein
MSAVNALLNGSNTHLGQLSGYKDTFSQIKAVQPQLVKDRARGTYYREVAFGKLDAANRTALKSALGQSLILGESIPEISARIRSVIHVSQARAETIARTECMRSLSQGMMLCGYEARSLGLSVKKKWVCTHDDGRTRESHLHMDGEIVDLDEPFSNGLMYPHDPGGEPGEIINCRCTYEIIVDSSGDSDIMGSDLEDGSSWLCKDDSETQIDNIRQMTPELERDAQNLMSTMRREFPGLPVDDHIKGVYIGNISASGTADIYGRYDRVSGYVFIDEKVLAGQIPKVFAVDGQIGILSHEMSHGLSYAKSKEVAAQSVVDAYKRSGSSSNIIAWVGNGISPYARENANEAFTEAMSDFIVNGDKAKPASLLVVECWRNS